MRAFYVFMSFLVVILVVGFFIYISNNMQNPVAQQPTAQNIEVGTMQPPPQQAPSTVETHVIEREKLVPMPIQAKPDTSTQDAAPAEQPANP